MEVCDVITHTLCITNVNIPLYEEQTVMMPLPYVVFIIILH